MPKQVYDRVVQNAEGESLPQTGKAVYRRYVELTYLRPYYAIPFFLVVFILFLVFAGQVHGGRHRQLLLGPLRRGNPPPAAGAQRLLRRQAGDRLLLQRAADEVHPGRGRRVSAPGMWSIAFVTSEGFQAIRATTDEPLVGVFIPTSPMPMTGYALTVRKSEVVDLHMTIDEAIQFIVSCGLVIPAGDVKQLQAGT